MILSDLKLNTQLKKRNTYPLSLGNIIVEDVFVEFYHANGTLVSKGNSLFVWKKEEDEWRIFRDVYMPIK